MFQSSKIVRSSCRQGKPEVIDNLPIGAVVTFSEDIVKDDERFVWAEPVFSPAEITVPTLEDDQVTVTVTNNAAWAPGTFGISKQVAGIPLDSPDVSETVDVLATWVIDEKVESRTLSIPTDGSRVEFGQELPHGTKVHLSEEAPAGTVAFSWATPVWDAERVTEHEDGSATVVIAAADDLNVTVTNTAEANLGSIEILKTLTGDGAADVPDDTVFPVTAKWNDLFGEEQEIEFELTAGEAETVDNLPFGTEITFQEETVDLPRGVKWVDADWVDATADNASSTMTIAESGDLAVIVVDAEKGSTVSLELVNEFEKQDELSNTGAATTTVITLSSLAVLLVSAGIVLLIRRRIS